MYYGLQGCLLVYKAKKDSIKNDTQNLKDTLREYFSSGSEDAQYFLLSETEDSFQIYIKNKNQEDQAIERKRYTITFDSDKKIAYGTSQIIRTINGLDSFSISSSSGVHYAFGSEIKKSYKVEGGEIVFIPENFMYSITDIVDPVRIIINNGGWNFVMTTASSKSLIVRRNILFALSLISFVTVSFLYSKYTVALTSFLTDGFVYYK
jgi:hypothetical protein